MTSDVAAAARLLIDASAAGDLDAATRQAVIETMSAPARLEVEGSTLRCHVHSVTEDARVRKFKEPWTIVWLRALPAGAVLYDVGANIGITALVAAEDASRAIRVVAIEPAPANFASLVKNIRANALGDRVSALPIGLGGVTAVSDLSLSTCEPGGSLHAFGPFRFSKAERETRVEGVHRCLCLRLDDLVRWEGLPFPTHLKIDVDGFERDVLAGGRDTLADPRVRGAQIEVVDADASGAESREVIALMESLGFSLTARYPHRYPGVTDLQFGR